MTVSTHSVDENDQVKRLGFWSAAIVTALGIIYFLVILFAIITGQFVQPPAWLQLFGGIITLVSAPIIVAVMTALHFVAPQNKKIYSQLALGFSLLFALAVSINRFTQLGVVRQSQMSGNLEGISWFLAYGDYSVMLGLEFLGWSWFLGLAFLCAAPIFSNARLDTWLHWLSFGYGVLALLGALGFLMASPLSLLGFIAWGVVLFIITALLMVYFKRA